MADSAHSTGDEPKQLDKNITVDDDMISINDPDHDSISDFSKTTRENTRLFSDPTVCEPASVSHVSCGDQPREAVCRQREREEREGSVINISGVDVKKKSTEQYKESFSSDSPRIQF